MKRHMGALVVGIAAIGLPGAAPAADGAWKAVDEPRLTRHGYSVRSLSDQFSVKPAEIRQFLRGELSGVRAQELTQQMQAAGLPL